MKPHDPYGPLLDELCKRNDNDNEELFRESLRITQPAIRALRAAYRNCPSRADYSDPTTRAAYLIAYYPYYIEPLYHVLHQLPDDFAKTLFNYPKLRACFLGAGPAPEALGWLSFLHETCPDVTSVTAYLFDLHVDGWRTGQEITRYHLKEQYWPGKELILIPHACDMLGVDFINSQWADRAIKIAHLYVMQNSINEYIGKEKEFIRNFERLFEATQPGALFVIIDLDFEPIKNLIRLTERHITRRNLGEVIIPVKDIRETVTSSIVLPQILKEELFLDEDGLRAKRHTHFYFSVLMRGG